MNKFFTWVVTTAKSVWSWILTASKNVKDFVVKVVSYLNNPKTGKLSPKRIAALGLFLAGIRQLVIKDYWGALVVFVTTAVLVILALTRKE